MLHSVKFYLNRFNAICCQSNIIALTITNIRFCYSCCCFYFFSIQSFRLNLFPNHKCEQLGSVNQVNIDSIFDTHLEFFGFFLSFHMEPITLPLISQTNAHLHFGIFLDTQKCSAFLLLLH